MDPNDSYCCCEKVTVGCLWCLDLLRYNDQLEQYRAATKLSGPEVGGSVEFRIQRLPHFGGEGLEPETSAIHVFARFPAEKIYQRLPFRIFAQVFSDGKKNHHLDKQVLSNIFVHSRVNKTHPRLSDVSSVFFRPTNPWL